jgi:putative acetyltransferase
VICLRPARPEDALKIRNVHVASIRALCAGEYTPEQIAAWTANARPERYRRAMAEGEIMFVAERGPRIVGFSALRDDEVRAVYVHPRLTRRGVGTLLLRAAEEAARARGIVELHLSASLTAVPFYRSQGYRECGNATHRLSTGMLIPCVEMAKRLREPAA